MKSYRDILTENKQPISEEDLIAGFNFYVVSSNGRSLSRYRIVGGTELNIGSVLKVKHVVIAGDKFKQSVIAKDHVLGQQGNLKVFRTRKLAMIAFKRSGMNMNEEKGDFIDHRRGAWYIYDTNQNIIGGPFKRENEAKREFKRMTEARAMNPSESDAEVIVSYTDIQGRTGMKSFKTRKSFDRWFSKNEGKVKIIDYIKDRD
jgi:hypothetical protein